MILKNGWLIAGFFTTACYVVGAAYFAFAKDDVLTRFIGLGLNEQGDTAAGVFAPLAFLWLFIATMIQSQELKLQRQEIADNRAVMREQATAAEHQAKFLESQAEAMQAQTTLLMEQTEIARTTARRNHKLSMFDRRIETYKAVIEMRKRSTHGSWFLNSDPHTLRELGNRAVFLFGKEVAEWLANIASEIERTVDHKVRMQSVAVLSKEDEAYDLRDDNGMTYGEIKAELERAVEWLEKQFSPDVVNSLFEPYLNIMEGGPVVADVGIEYSIGPPGPSGRIPM